jgi:hypothetical protein
VPAVKCRRPRQELAVLGHGDSKSFPHCAHARRHCLALTPGVLAARMLSAPAPCIGAYRRMVA